MLRRRERVAEGPHRELSLITGFFLSKVAREVWGKQLAIAGRMSTIIGRQSRGG